MSKKKSFTYESDNFLKLLSAVTSNQQGTLPVGTTFESFEASITCIALLNRMQGIKYELKCKVKFGSSFDDAFHLGNIANSVREKF